MAGREKGTKIVDGKVVAPVETTPGELPELELPDLGSGKKEKDSEPMVDGRLSIEPVHNGIQVKIQPAEVLHDGMKPEALLQAYTKQNQWVTIVEVSPVGGKIVLKKPKKVDPSQEYTSVRLMEGTCQVKFGGNDE